MPEQDRPPFLMDQQPQQASKDKKPTPEGNFKALSSKVNDTEARLRVLEERYGNIRKKTQLTDQNMLEFEKEFGREIKVVMQDITEVKKKISLALEKLQQMGSELEKTATRYDVKTLEKYLDLWQPVEFVQKQTSPEQKE